ncbi:hypothetical protein [Sinorhizobium americanum]|uniref:hypothetical protein n=1 Tax=Sinorhizobium americanum TaxID=194963 RepID=UPI0010521D6C|nr:hypothetical protein [Sinorhizobium americanum]
MKLSAIALIALPLLVYPAPPALSDEFRTASDLSFSEGNNNQGVVDDVAAAKIWKMAARNGLELISVGVGDGGNGISLTIGAACKEASAFSREVEKNSQ